MTIHHAFAAAKINLTLQVLGRRCDGYHELRSIVVFADLGDHLSLDMNGPVGVTLSGPFGAILGRDGLIDKAFELLHDQAAQIKLGHVSLHKNLPIAAGLGGGSADAAAVLRLVKQANDAAVCAPVDWQKIALSLGADVPICMAGVPALMSGMGEVVRPFKKFPVLAAVLVNAQQAVPENKTARIFQELAAPDLAAADIAAAQMVPMPAGIELSENELLSEMQSHGNDLQEICIRIMPVVDVVLAALRHSEGCRLARLSGAGPSCFGLFASHQAATAAAEALAQAHPQWWVRAVTLAGAAAEPNGSG